MIQRRPLEMSLGERAILRTVVYSSLFDWPLKVEEIHRNLQEHPLEESSILEIYQSSSWLPSIMDYQDGYLFLKGCDAMVQKRGRREERSRAILKANRWVLKLISLIPYVRMVAISGSAAQLNMDEDGDIDLFLVTRGNRVWSLAVTILVLTKLLGRRKMVCFNFILSDQRLVIDRQDLFNANQIAHLKPVLGEEVYERFIQVNPFVARFYPNLKATSLTWAYRPPGILRILKGTTEWILSFGLGQIQEFLCRKTYAWYLGRQSPRWKSPQEVVMEKGCLKLHTNSHREKVIEAFEEALRQAESRMGGEKVGGASGAESGSRS